MSETKKFIEDRLGKPHEELNLVIGHVYSAKKSQRVGLFNPLLNDRQIIWMNADGSAIQYDSPTVAFGRKHPIVTRERFLKWAKTDVTDQCPSNGDWRSA